MKTVTGSPKNEGDHLRGGGRGGGRGRGGFRGRGGGRGGGEGGRGGGRGGFRNRNDDENSGYKKYENYEDADDNDYNNRGNGRKGSREDGNDDKEEPQKPKEIYIPPDLTEDESVLFGNGVSAGINFDKYDNIEVQVSGENVPSPIESFQAAGLRNIVLENITKSGYTKPTPVQKHALPIIMSGRDLMACAQTGSGKTAAFAVPIINTLLEKSTDLVITGSHCEPQVVIVSPTRELTIQIYQQIVKFALSSNFKNSSCIWWNVCYSSRRETFCGLSYTRSYTWQTIRFPRQRKD